MKSCFIITTSTFHFWVLCAHGDRLPGSHIFLQRSDSQACCLLSCIPSPPWDCKRKLPQSAETPRPFSRHHQVHTHLHFLPHAAAHHSCAGEQTDNSPGENFWASSYRQLSRDVSVMEAKAHLSILISSDFYKWTRALMIKTPPPFSSSTSWIKVFPWIFLLTDSLKSRRYIIASFLVTKNLSAYLFLKFC